MIGATSLYDFYLTMFGVFDRFAWTAEAVNNDLFFGVAFYSTFFTSAWLWLFGLSYLAITVAGRSEPFLDAVKYILPIDEKPFRSLGIIAGLIAMLSYWTFSTYQWLFNTVV